MTALYLVEIWFLLSIAAGLLIGRCINMLYNADELNLQLVWEG